MSPAAQRLLAALADGYLAVFEDLGGYDGRGAELRKTMKFDGDLHAATMELRDAGMVDIAANGSGTAWINDKGRAASAPKIPNHPEGWTLVPNEVTHAMQRAYFDVIDRNLHRVSTDALFGRHASAKEAYRAMLAAAPACAPKEQMP